MPKFQSLRESEGEIQSRESGRNARIVGLSRQNWGQCQRCYLTSLRFVAGGQLGEVVFGMMKNCS